MKIKEFAPSGRGKRFGMHRPAGSSLQLEVLEERRLLSVTPQLLKDIQFGSSSSEQFVFPSFTAVGDKVFFGANDGTSSNLELWESDGTPSGTLRVPSGGNGALSVYGSGFGALANANGTLFFAGPGEELWKTDGTTAGTMQVKDINPSGGAGLNFTLGPENLTNVNGTLFFTANDGVHGSELWKTDGTAAGTALVKDITTVTVGGNLYMRSFTNVNGTLFFLDNDGTHGEELWKSDGTAAGTVMVDDINPTSSGFTLNSGLTEVNGTLFFSANDGTHGQELWKSDGTAAGTVMVQDINSGSAQSYPRGLTNVNGTLFFEANDGTHGYELWKSDGTAGGTMLVQDIWPGNLSSNPGGTNVNGTFVFSANDGTHGQELWKSDGTATGTVMVKDTNPGPGGYGLSSVTNVNGSIFFSSDDGTHGRQLWTSDGTTAGTLEFNNINPSIESLPLDFSNFNGSLIFTANDGVHGFEPWIVPGLAVDLNGGAAGTSFMATWGAAPVAIVASTATISETGPTNLLSMTASLDNPQSGDVLAANTAGTAITASFDGTTLSLAGDDSLQHYQQVLRSITFNNTHGHSSAVVSENVTITAVNELHSANTAATATIIMDQSPVVDLNGAAAGIDFSPTWSGSAVALADPNATLSDPDSSTLASLVVQLVSPKSGDLLAANTAGTSITAHYSGGILTLGGSDSLAHYQQVMRTVSYDNASGTPSADVKTVNFMAFDPVGASGRAVTTITINFTPSLSASSISRNEGNGGNTAFVFTVTLSDVSSHTVSVRYATADGTASVAGNDYLATSGTLFFAAGVTSQFVTVLVNGDLAYEPNESFFVNLSNPVNALLSSAQVTGTIINDDAPPPLLLKDLNPGGGDSSPASFVAVGGSVYFSANDGMHGVELWKTDGTAAGTVMVTDLSPGSASSNPTSLTNVNGILFFSADDGAAGQELWKTDGTTAGTVLIDDISPGSSSSNPVQFANVNGTLFFAADDGSGGQELWKSDGTAAGTSMVKDIAPGSASSSPLSLVNVNGTLFFSANDGTAGRELWKSDGTAAGTSMVSDVAPGSASSAPAQLTDVNGALFFVANDGSHGNEIWVSDGTVAGTMLVKDINPGSVGSSPSGLMNSNGYLYFQANDGSDGAELWYSDGTVDGTLMISDLNLGSSSASPAYLTNVNGVLFFQANNGGSGPELWKYDSMTGGTMLVKDIRPGSLGSAPSSLTNVDGTLFFTADDGTHGTELWESDGTTAGTVQVADIDAGSAGAGPSGLTVAGSSLFFSASDGATGIEPWVLPPTPPIVGFAHLSVAQAEGNSGATPFVFTVSLSAASQQSVTVAYATADGTATTAENDYVAASGTLTFAPGQTSLPITVLVNGNVVYEFDETFSVNLSSPVNAVLSAGLATGTIVNDDPALPKPPQLLKSGGFGAGSNPVDFASVGSTLFFVANDGTHPGDLWKSDGTVAGTVDLASGNPNAPINISQLTNINGTLYFVANGTNSGLWKSDGTVAGTVRVSANAGSTLTNVNGTIFFASFNQIWKSNGTAAGTVLVKSIPSSGGSQPISGLANVGGALFFDANDGTHGYELWKSDGTAAGTTMVADINPGSGNAFPSGFNNIASLNGLALFAANDGTHGLELWKSDGTAAGTTMLMDINPGGIGSNAWSDGFRFTEVNGTQFFLANDGTHGDELWKTDGTTAGTALVEDINPGSASSFPYQMVNGNGALFFLAHNNSGLEEVWKSDGTVAGTLPMESSMRALYLANVNGTVFFGGSNSILGPGYPAGYSLWKTDGTTAGTVFVKQINLNSNLINVNGTLFASAYTASYGRELWKSDGTTAGTVLVKDIDPAASGEFESGQFTGVGPTTFFTAVDGANGGELWKTDGTSGGTSLVKDILPGTLSSAPFALTNVAGTLFFVANDGAHGSELWKSDGTVAGTVLVKDVQPGASSSMISNMTNVNGELFFVANDGIHGYELWKSDGTTLGTALVADIAPSSLNSSPHNLTSFDGLLFFAANDGTHGTQLWESDGTPAGTMVVPVAQSLTSPGPMYNLNGALFFGANLGNSSDLFKTDGSSLVNLGGLTGIAQFTNVNGDLFFTADNGFTGNELWKTDGTTVGTVLVKDIYARWRYGYVNHFPYSSNPTNLTNVNGTLFFQANDQTSGRELWKSDGTAGGTLIVKDIAPGIDDEGEYGSFPASSNPSYLTNLNGALIFVAEASGLNSLSLWTSDGTANGTVVAATLGNPKNLVDVDGTLFLSGVGGSGVQPYIIENAPPVPSITRTGADPTHAASVQFTVTFNIGVTGVDASDFSLAATGGVTGASITSVTGSGNAYIVTASTGTGDGALGLILADDDSIADQSGNLLGGPGMGNGSITGPSYTIDKTAPAVALTSLTNPIGLADQHNTLASGTGEPGAVIVVVAGDGTHASLAYSTTVAPNGAWSIGGIDVAALNDGTITYTATATDLAGNTAQSSLTSEKTVPAAVAGAFLFYRNSPRYDTTGNSQATLPFSDDNAIASDKTAYLPGAAAATFANVSNYDKGINGIMVDLAGNGAHGSITLANILSDFTFKVGNNNAPNLWSVASTPTAVTVRSGAGIGGTDRVELIWPDNAIQQEWLEVTVNATADTGLAVDDVFFFGSEIGATGSSNTATIVKVGAADVTDTQTHGASLKANILITNVYDFNKDGQVNSSDITDSQTHGTSNKNGLQLIDIGSGGPFAPQVAPMATATGSADSGVASALASTTASPAQPPVPAWIVNRVARIDVNRDLVAQYFEQLAHEDTARFRTMLVNADEFSDSLGLDDELFDALIASSKL